MSDKSKETPLILLVVLLSKGTVELDGNVEFIWAWRPVEIDTFSEPLESLKLSFTPFKVTLWGAKIFAKTPVPEPSCPSEVHETIMFPFDNSIALASFWSPEVNELIWNSTPDLLPSELKNCPYIPEPSPSCPDWLSQTARKPPLESAVTLPFACVPLVVVLTCM